MTDKAARLESMIVTKGAAKPGTRKRTALTVKLDATLYQRLLDHVAKHRPLADDPRSVSNQSVMVAALEEYLSVHT